MAQPGNTFETIDAKGLREDLSDIIYAIDSTETPFLSMAGRGTASGIKHEWQVDQLATAAENALVELDVMLNDVVEQNEVLRMAQRV